MVQRIPWCKFGLHWPALFINPFVKSRGTNSRAQLYSSLKHMFFGAKQLSVNNYLVFVCICHMVSRPPTVSSLAFVVLPWIVHLTFWKSNSSSLKWKECTVTMSLCSVVAKGYKLQECCVEEYRSRTEGLSWCLPSCVTLDDLLMSVTVILLTCSTAIIVTLPREAVKQYL